MNPNKWFAIQRRFKKKGKTEDRRVAGLGPVDIFIQKIVVDREAVIHYTGVAKRNNFSGVYAMPLQDYQATSSPEHLKEKIKEELRLSFRKAQLLNQSANNKRLI